MARAKLQSFVPPGTFTIGVIHADGLGIWTEGDATVAFYLEHDTGTEALPVLANKLHGYDNLRRRGGPAWPVLFWLHSTLRETHLHRRLTEARPAVPVATAARDRLGDRSPADAIWHLHATTAPLLPLAALPMTDPVDVGAFDAVAGYTQQEYTRTEPRGNRR